MKASDITDEPIVTAVRETRGRYGVPRWATKLDVQERLAPVPPKVVLAKLASAIRRGVLLGCACGCRGDFEIPDDECGSKI